MSLADHHLVMHRGLVRGRKACAAALLGIALSWAAALPMRAEERPGLDPDALAAVEKVAGFFATRLAISGGYVYAYTPDLSVHRGEGGEVEKGVVWNQPPATPAVGGAFLRLYELTKNPRWMEAAAAAIRVTLEGQLLSGGWFNFTDTSPSGKAAWCYRAAVRTEEECDRLEANRLRNDGTFDDNITQSNLGFLMWYQEVRGEPDPAVNEAIRYALDHVVAAQYPNGAWPLSLDRVFPHALFAAAWRSRLPAAWSRTWAEPPNSALILNDHLVRNVIRLLLAAERRTGREDLLAAARRSGDFLLASQLPAPQRGWAQTYNLDLEPVWGRKFEPPAVASAETAGSIEALLQLYLRTGERRYLEGAQEAAEWLRASRRPSGDWARFYELGSNRPLFVGRNNELTYEEKDLRRGYSLAGEFGVPAVLDLVDKVAAGERPDTFDGWDWIFEPSLARGDELRTVAADAGEEGQIVEDGWIESNTFVEAVRALGRSAGTADH